MMVMFRHWYCVLLLTAVLNASGGRVAFAQTEIPALHEIRLPIPASRGSFGGGFLAGSVPSYERFAVRLLPDQRLLVMNPNSTGQWSLTRVGKWWTDSPELESLVVPGWNAANVHREMDITTGMLVTPDGAYAAVVSGVEEVKDAKHIPIAPSQSIAGKPDTLVVLVDMKGWRVIGGFHTATLGNFDFRRAQVAGGRWVALEGYIPIGEKYHRVPSKRVNQLISIPDLAAGPRCFFVTSESLIVADAVKEAAELGLSRENNTRCGELLNATGLTSLYRFESLMYLGTEPAPETYEPHPQHRRGLLVGRFSTGAGSIDERNFNQDAMIGRERRFTPDNDYLQHDNPPFQSHAGFWYELQHQRGTARTYHLAKYDHAGATLSMKPTTLLDREGCAQWGHCDCRVEDVREDANGLLAHCRGYTADSWNIAHWKAQWITVFRATDLSEMGDIPLSRDHLTKQVLATIEGKSYVLVVEQGETLRIHQVPTETATSFVGSFH